MKRRNPGLTLVVLGLISLIISLALAGCGNSASNSATLPTVTASRSEPSTPTQAITSTTATSQPAITQDNRGQVSMDQQPSQTGTTAANEHERVKTPVGAGGAAPGSKGYPGQIVFDTADNQIIIIKPDGSERQKVADGFSPLFSPDGQQIAYLSRTGSTPIDSLTTVNTINLDGTNRQTLCETGGSAEVKLVRWSPRNRFIALTATQQDGPGAVYLCNITDHTLNKAITTTQGTVAGLYDWTPDGEKAVW